MPISRILGKAYQYESVKKIKNVLRPVKHALFGKNGIYKAMETVAELEGGAANVKIIFDIGAAGGEYVLHFLGYFSNAIIYCFEPSREQFEELEWRTKKFKDRIRLFNHGLYKEAATLDFNVAPYRDASSLLVKKDIHGSIVEKVIVKRLDDFIAEHKIGKIEFMKIDVEGVEKEVIEGGLLTMKNLVDNLYVEIQPAFKGYRNPDYIKVFQYLYDCGFGFIGVFEDYFFSKLI